MKSTSRFHLRTAAAIALGLWLAPRAHADNYTVLLQPTNGLHVPAILGASGSIDSSTGFSGFDYFEWFGITHHRYWFKPSFSPINPTGGVTNVSGFQTAAAAVRADPWRQGTASDVYFDWKRFKSEFDPSQRYFFDRMGCLRITPMLVNTMFTDQDPLTDWGYQFEYWRYWYAYVYYFASQFGLTMYEFRNEPNADSSYAQWESHWLVCADAARKAIADVNANYSTNLVLRLCGPTLPGPYWDYSLPDPAVDPHGWGSVSWGKIQTDLYGNFDASIWNYGLYDYHRYRNSAPQNRAEIAALRLSIATATNSPNATIPLLISEYNTATGDVFASLNLDPEDLSYGIGVASILQATATLGPAGLGDDGGLFLFKLGAADATSATLMNKVAYVSARGDYNYGGITRGGVCFALYARHFRGGKPLLGTQTTAGSNSLRQAVAVLDASRRAYYVYLSNLSGTNATATLDCAALDVQAGAPVTLARVDANNTGQVTDYLALSSAKTITFSVPSLSAVLAWIPQAGSAAAVAAPLPVDDTYLVVGESSGNHGAESTLKVSLHHSTAAERRVGLFQFDLSSLTNGNRCLLRLTGHNTGTNQAAREILHLFGVAGGGWSSTNLAWSAAPGVGQYHSSTNALSATTGLGSMVDIEDNYAGVTPGAGLGLCGKFLGPVSFYSPDWATNYVDVTDFVRSLLATNQLTATFVLARIVRYDVLQYSNATYYAQGVYDSDGRVVEIASKEHATPAFRPALVAWADTTSVPTNLTIVAAGPAEFQLSGQGPASQNYGVYACTNPLQPVTNWWRLGTTNTGSDGTFRFLDSTATNRQRFYRIGTGW